MAAPDRMAMHQGTTPFWTFKEDVEGYLRHGFRAMTVRRDKLAEYGIEKAARLMRDSGMEVIGLSGISPLTATDPALRREHLDDNKRAIDDAAAIGAGFIVVIGGGLPQGSRDLVGAREAMIDMMAELGPYGLERGVRLGLEPLTPMVAGELSCCNLMSTANDMCDTLGASSGIIVDLWHVWWDPALKAELERAGGERLLALHLCDWRAPLKDRFLDRAMMGDGMIDIPAIEGWMREAGYTGWNEVEIFSAQDWWTRDPDAFLATCAARYASHV